jgi:thymidylate synthase (FAD)
MLYFDEPAALKNNKRKSRRMSISEFYKKWHQGAVPVRTMWGNEVVVPLKERLQQMNLRSCDEITGEIKHTKVTDIWQTGIKDVFEVELQNGYKLKMTKDHLCLTEDGWHTLEEATDLNISPSGRVTWRDNHTNFAVNGIPFYQDRNWLQEKRNMKLSVADIAQQAGASYHTIRKYLKKFDLKFTPKERGALSGKAQQGTKRGNIKRSPLTQEALNNIRKARSGPNSNFWKGGVATDRENIGRWTTENAPKVFSRDNYKCALCGCDRKLNAHHIDPVWNNVEKACNLENLITLCVVCHKKLHINNLEMAFIEYHAKNNLAKFWEDFSNIKYPRQKNKKLQKFLRLVRTFSKIKQITYIGKEMTYDLSVDGPFHNFVCNGFIVHNSLNEMSARYSVMKDEFYFPQAEDLRKQSTSNKQGSDGKIEQIQASVFSESIKEQCDAAYALYLRMLEAGITREQARMILPVNLYTQFYWKQNLHNMLHLLALRMDHHAQYEIRVYANAMYEIVRHLCPWTIEAFDKYHPLRGAVKLTSLEKDAIKKHNIENNSISSIGEIATENKREQGEWKTKAKELGFEF